MPMDSATRNFLGLVGIAATLAAYAVCGFIAYVLIPFLDLHSGALARLGPVCLLPAVVLTTFVRTSSGLAIRAPVGQNSPPLGLLRPGRVLSLPSPPALLAP